MDEFWRLVGATVLGALISFGTIFFFERRREERTEAAEKQQSALQLRQAIRLVEEELLDITLTIDTACDNGAWWSSPPYQLRQVLWTEHRAALAYLLDDREVWDYLTTASTEITKFNARLKAASDGREIISDIGTRLDPISRYDITDAWDQELRHLNGPIQHVFEKLGT